MKTFNLLCLLGLFVITTTTVCALDYPGASPGTAKAHCTATEATLENNAIAMHWTFSDGHLKPNRLTDKQSAASLPLGDSECFQFILGQTPDPRTRLLKASDLKLAAQPTMKPVQAEPGSLRLGDHFAGWELSARLVSTAPEFEVVWRAVLRDDSNYIRQEVTLRPLREPLEVVEAVVLELRAPEAAVAGSVDGSPVVARTFFFGAEHPMSKSRLLDEDANAGTPRFKCAYDTHAVLAPAQPCQFRSVAGVVPAGQLRRGFLHYLERERVQPYRPLLHYNNGFEIGFEYWARKLFGAPGDAEAFRRKEQQVWLDAIEVFGRELVTKRGVVLDSFAHDFQWDDENLVWQFHEGYPDGFHPAQQAAARFGSHLGVWLSPFGGYPCKKYRLESGRKQGFLTTRMGLTLACPNYAARFEAACQGLLKYGVNYFKFDGFGAGNNQTGALDYASDVDGLLNVIVHLRRTKPDIFINPSTGSWPSPFWLFYADSIWRQGHDTNVEGKGSVRQKWITYRDGQIKAGTLARGPLYPVNSLMIHGVYINHSAVSFKGSPYDPKNPRPTYDEQEIIAEIRSFFATGTNLQELYIATDLMTVAMWDALAEAAKWSRANTDVLVDTHSIGGDPAKGEVYGWASWSRRKGVLSLRNPSDQPATFALDLAEAFELPADERPAYFLKSPWVKDAAAVPIRVAPGQRHTFELRPFEVAIFDATPTK